MPRLFTALKLPGPLPLRLSLLRGGLPGARWGEPENYHVTLRFLGDVDDRVAEEASALLDSSHVAPFALRLIGVDAFGGSRPRSIYARVDGGDALFELQEAQERLMRRLGLPPETRKYTPHVTLARLRGVSAEAVASWLSANAAAASGEVFEPKGFALFSSRASTGGGPYICEQFYPFSGCDDGGEADDEADWQGPR
ncbi:RNA 2',3'-cyclic phosphodiesterase [Terrihabitans rhizophilus]|uniref:RNA 2',3'-cyclic phosphodiesterase n=1 Tax=Terrihabitans rhizophilus TaxID=3092662 RepID=A0ABU4RPE2_9HYPH|nr:RNA 2',3'-cyclic phosphodiesterase [Terrihabitans sp. PJ23]MDX6806058.1 RNA 2',3'-cyclic phosphodiesterase [Terrihabitans sp. PJ23]